MRSRINPVMLLGSVLLAVCFVLAQTTALSAKSDETVNTVKLQPRVVPEKPASTDIAGGVDISHVVVKFTNQAAVRLRDDRLFSKSNVSTMDAQTAVAGYLPSRMKRLFSGFGEARLDRDKEVFEAVTGHELADLNSYYRIEVNSAGEAQRLINELNRLDIVEIAYFVPKPEPAGDIAPPTPNYTSYQDYREAAPAGVDADYANTLPGGDGSGVKIIDVEGAWQETHEDLDKALGGVIGGFEIDDLSWRNHGTAVLGEMIGGDNGYGVTGICPGANVGMVSIAALSTAEAIYTAVDNLTRGDAILIELHAPGPHYDFQVRSDQAGYVCMEYWQDNFDAIQYAWAKGIVVVEAGGNGGENFDDVNIYGQLFDTTYRNSHAIIVGAGYPASSSLNLYRQSFSNYGERVNVQGYGSGVYTTGYGGLFTGGGDENQYYTSSFSGTSSASPIITGAVACLQGYYKQTYGVVLTSDNIRDAFVATGTHQLGDTTQHIGPRPDLQGAIAAATPPPSLYANPYFLDTTLGEGDIAVQTLWLINRSASASLYFYINGNDSLVKTTATNWLTTAPTSGVVAPLDSLAIDVTLDATVLIERLEAYKGVVEVMWGHSAGSLDSLVRVPVYLYMPCSDSTYTALSTNDPDGPTYNWISAKTLGTKIDNATYYGSGTVLDDGSTGPWPIGFSFNFYDQLYDNVYIGVNGGLSFTDTDLNVGGYYSALTIPGAPFSTLLAAFWNDLIIDNTAVPQAGIYIYKSATADTMVIEWYRLANFNAAGDTLTDFEVILTDDGNIKYQYNNVGSSGLELQALIGLSEIGCNGLSYVNSSDIPEHVVGNGDAVAFNSASMWVMAGNVDGLGDIIDIADLVYMVEYMFAGGPEPIPYESGNVDCIADIDIADLVYLVSYMFDSGPAPCYFLP